MEMEKFVMIQIRKNVLAIGMLQKYLKVKLIEIYGQFYLMTVLMKKQELHLQKQAI